MGGVPPHDARRLAAVDWLIVGLLALAVGLAALFIWATA